MNRLIKMLLTLSVLGWLVGSCSSEKRVSVDPKFSQWISGYTSGIVSNTDEIRIELQDPIDSLYLKKLRLHSATDTSILDKLITIKPKMSARYVWRNERTIEIIPDEPLKSNALYTIQFDLDKIAQVEDGYETFTFQFATKPLTMDVANCVLYEYDNYHLEWYSMHGSVVFSDQFDTSKLNNTIIRANLDGVEKKVRLEKQYGEGVYEVIIDSILRTDNEQKLVLTWDGAPIQSPSRGKQTLTVKKLGDFNLTNCEVTNEETQSIQLTFSEPISSEQDLTGLIELRGIRGLTFSTYFNQVTVFLPHRVEGQHVLTIHPGIQNSKNHRLTKSFERSIHFKGADPEIRLVGNGNILPDSKGLIFPFETIGLKSATVRVIKIFENNVHHFLQVNDLNESDAIFRFGKKMVEKEINLHVDSTQKNQWISHVINLEKLIKPELGAIYRVAIKFKRSDTWCNCPVNPDDSENSDENFTEYERKNPDWEEDSWFMDDWDDGYENWGGYHSDPCNNDYYYGRAVARNILASNIGVIYKLDARKTGHVFLTDMITAQPLAGAQVTFYDYTKQIIASGTSNSEGMFTTPLKSKPFLLIARYGAQRGYLKVGDRHTKSLTEFDVRGETVDNGLKGYIYTERGVWRPGDSIFVNFVLRDYEQKLPDSHPVTFTLTDPQGQTITTLTKTGGLNGHYAFPCRTGTEAPTGIYTANVQVGSRTFTKYLKIETVKPNRLKMNLRTNASTNPDSVYHFEARWLHGAPANNLRASVEVEYHSQTTSIPGFQNYIFDSPLRRTHSDRQTIYDNKLNKAGTADFQVNSVRHQNASGMLKAVYTMRVFENSGNFSIDRFSEEYSPFENYVGIRIPKSGGDHTLLAGKKHTFQLVVTDRNGTPVKQDTRIHVSVYLLQWHWWYDGTDDDFSNFTAKNGNQLVYDTLLTTHNGTSDFRFGLNETNYGRFLVLATDEKGNHQTGTIVTIDLPYWRRGNQENNSFASMLKFSTDKTSYQKGETVKVVIPSPAAGKALISVETRTKIVKKFWVSTLKGETTCSFTATEDMAPNAYIHVSLIQPHASTANDLPIRMYGILPVSVENPETHLKPVIRTANEWEPESTVSITVSEQQHRGMTYTLAIVDEGLLDLTRFNTPDPWKTFYAKEALGIKTWDVYDAVLGAYTGKMNRMISIGGDESANDGAGPKANRFKPMVRFLGPFAIGPNQSKKHKVDIPAYMGSVRVMVVAHSQLSFGSGEVTVPVRKPLMILGTLPRVLSPNEQIVLPVDLFSMTKKAQQVKVQVSSNELIQVEDRAEQSIRLDPEGNEMLYFRLKIKNRQGIAKVSIRATSETDQAHYDFEVDVRPPNTAVIENKNLWLEPGKSTSFIRENPGIPGSNSYLLEITQHLPLNLSGRLSELIVYPHGCIEQTTSAVFPQLLALEMVNCVPTEKNTMSKNIQAALKKYHSFQTADGGFAYWPGMSYSSEWGSNYAGHFLVLSEKQGFQVSSSLKQRWLSYQREKANNWSDNISGYYGSHTQETNTLIQAYRLYTLALAGKPEIGAMNRLRERGNLSNSTKWRLAAAYQLAGQHDAAMKLTQNCTLEEAKYRELSYGYGSDLRDEAMNLEAAFLLGRGGTKKLEKQISDALQSGQWMSTQETAYCLLALASGSDLNTAYSVEVNGKTKSISKRVYTETYSESAAKETVTVKNTSKQKICVSLVTRYVPPQGKERTEHSKLNMRISYLDMNGIPISPDKLKQGTDFRMKVEITNLSGTDFYREMTLNQLIPDGWEILNTRFMTDGVSNQSAEHQDIRDDRVYSYFKLAPNQTKTFQLQLNASYLGKFYLPAVFCEAMYDHTIYTQEKGRWIEVVRP